MSIIPLPKNHFELTILRLSTITTMSSLSGVYDRNMSQILQMLLSHGKLARSVIADRNSMTRTTVSNIVKDLRAKNIIHKTEEEFASALNNQKPIYLKIKR